ncbi:MAG TPA: amino acid adenylation domain-containing protein [Pyrinomonadaceae bacterium]
MSSLKERLEALSPQQRMLLEARLRNKKTKSAKIEKRESPENGPLSLDQERLWFLAQLDPQSFAYNLSNSYRLDGEFDVAVLMRTINEIIRRHETLRTWFPAVNGIPKQHIAAELNLPVPVFDLRDVAEPVLAETLLSITTDFTRLPFDLAVGPLLRLGVVRLNDSQSIMLLTVHHIVIDRWSFSLLWRELTVLYAAFSAGQPSPLPELKFQFADYAAWQRRRLTDELLNKHLDFWRGQLAGSSLVLEVPTDRSRPAIQTFNGARLYWHPDENVWNQLKSLCRSEGVTMFMMVLAAFNVLLLRYTGQTDINVGTPFANRDQVETEAMIGYLLNMIVIRARLEGDPTFKELLKQVCQTTLEVYQHSEVPFGLVVETLRPERDLSRNPLFQVAYVHVDSDDSVAAPTEISIHGVQVDAGSSIFDLSLGLRNTPNLATLILEYNTDLFERRTIERMARHFDRLLAGIVANAGVRVWELPLLNDEEQRWLRSVGKGEVWSYESSQLVHELFEEQAARRPNASALVDRERELSYGELNRRANQLAHCLRRQGVGIESRVGVLLERKAELVVALLAVLKTGAAYVPLDPGYPTERLRFMVEDAGAEVLLSESDFELTSAVKQIRFAEEQWAAESETDLGVTIASANLSHVIYTSGTTGRPKGVMITHGATRELMQWVREAYSAEELGGMLFSTSVCFDLSVFEMFAPLAWGGRVIIAANALELGEVVGVRVVNTVPTAMKELLRMEVDVTGMTINLAGEALPEELVEQLYERGARRVVNLYGPTEDTTYSTGEEVKAGERVMLGRALPNGRTYVLDEWLQEVPQGIVGELYLGGAGLARGYLGRSELTAERFVPDPYSEVAGERMYRTGDQVKYNGEGKLEYLGRSDQQVKLRGYRIELGEVETVLKGHEQVREAVAVVREGEDGAAARLIAYVVAEGETEVSGVELGNYLRERLPEYMAPLQYVLLKELPQTANGKIDRKRLPEPEREERPRESVTGPRSWAEEVLCEIWAEVLRLEQVGVDENFFQLGGDSILSVQVESRAAKRGLRFTTRQVFQHQTIAGLAAAATTVKSAYVRPAEKSAKVDPDGLTPADFPLARLTQEQLDRLVETISEQEAETDA